MRNPVMVGERVYLRPLEVADAPRFAEWSAQEEETFWASGRVPWSPLAEEALRKKLYEKEPPERIELAVCLKENDELIGSVELGDIDWVNRTAETGSYFGRTQHRGKGLGTEAKFLLLEYAFDHLNLHVLQSWVFEPNERSWRALARQGYQSAGAIPAMWMKDGAFRAVRVFDVMRDEWLAARRKWEAQRSVE